MTKNDKKMTKKVIFSKKTPKFCFITPKMSLTDSPNRNKKET